MRYAMSFILILSFAIGIPTSVLSFVALKKRSTLERLFLAFQVGLLTLMLFEAVIYFLYDVVRPTRQLVIEILFIGCRLILAALTVTLFLLAAEIVALDRRAFFTRFSLASVSILAVGTLAWSVAAAMTNLGFFEAIRHFDPIEALGYLILLYPIVLILFRRKQIQNMALSKAVLPFLGLGLLLIPAAVLEDYLLSRSSVPSLVLVLPIWILLFNGLVLYYGILHFLFPKYKKGAAVDVEAVAHVFSRYDITEREEQVLVLLVQGYSNREIGEKLFISPATVRNHVHNIFQKTDVRNRIGLTRLYAQR
jgi:DNA-binding CsgD family transcriptional regulator